MDGRPTVTSCQTIEHGFPLVEVVTNERAGGLITPNPSLY